MLAWLLVNNGELIKAESLVADNLAKCEQLYEQDDLDALTTYNAYAVLANKNGELRKAEEFSRKAVEGRERRLGPTHPSTLNALTNLSMVLASQAQKFDEGLELARKVLSLRQQRLGDYHIATLVSIVNLLRILPAWDGQQGETKPEMHQLKGKLEKALEMKVWGASMLANEVRQATCTGDSQILPVATMSQLGFKAWISDQISGYRAPVKRDLRALQSAEQQAQ